jgi:WD40 repeat protein
LILHPNYSALGLVSVLLMQIDELNSKLIVAYSDNTLVVWNTINMNHLHVLNHFDLPEKITVLSTPDNTNQIIISFSLNKIISWDYNTGNSIA